MTAIYKPKGRAFEYAGLAINQYLGCGHGCKYCYAAPMVQSLGLQAGQVKPRMEILDELKKQVPRFAGDKRRVLLSFLSDPYPAIEQSIHLTRQVMTILTQNRIPFQVLTKAAEFPQMDFDFYGPNDMFAVTLTFPDEKRSREWEPLAGTPQERIQNLKEAKANGIRTWASIEPVIDPVASLEIMEAAAPWVDLYKIGRLNHRRTDTDWRTFGIAAIELCRRLKKPFFIKNDLAQALIGFEYASTDTRTID